MRKLFFDMDGVLVNFQSGIDKLSEETKREYEGRLDEVPGIFSLMDPMPHAVEAVQVRASITISISFQQLHGIILRPGATRLCGLPSILAIRSRSA